MGRKHFVKIVQTLVRVVFKETYLGIYLIFTKKNIVLSLFKIDTNFTMYILTIFTWSLKTQVIRLHNLISMNIFFTQIYNCKETSENKQSRKQPLVLKTFVTCKGKHQCWRPLFNKLASLQLYQKESPTQVFSCKYYEIFKNTSGGCFQVIIVNTRNTLQSRKFRRYFYISGIFS